MAAFDRDASATNQALGISVGRPTGIPAILGVSAKRWRGSSNSGAVLSRSTGASEWRQDELRNRKLTAPEPVDDYVAVGDFEGYVHLLSRYDGRIVARARVDSKGIQEKPLGLLVDEFYQR